MSDAVLDLWGKAATHCGPVNNDEQLISLLRQGLPFTVLERITTLFNLSRDEVARVLVIPPRTLARRKREQRLAADESDRLYRLSRILAHAEQVFNNRSKVATWLHRPNQALHNAIPLDLLDTDIGATQVDDVLGRIEHGIFS